MKAGRYHELLSKIDTDISTDDKILKSLQEYQYNDEKIFNNRPDAKTDKVRNIDGSRRGPFLRYIPRLSVMRQALPSLAFLLLLIISVYGLVSGLYKDSKNNNSGLTASSETATDTGESLNGGTPDTDIEAAVSPEVSKAPEVSNDVSDTAPSGSDVTDQETTGSASDNTASDDSSAQTDTSATDASEAEVPSDSEEQADNETTDMSDDIHTVITANSAETVNNGSDYYKNDTYREDLQIYIKYNDASEVKSLFIQSLGSVKETNYTVEGNIITIRKEYLDTLAEGIYDLKINMDKGNPAMARFTVHPKDEESEYGFYRLSYYYWDFYLSDPMDFTFLVSNCKEARITGLRNGSVSIDPEFYELDESGFVATLYQSYLADMEEGINFNLVVEFGNGMEKTIVIRIRNKEVNTPIVNPVYNIFEKSKPEDVVVKITWNDAKYITSIDPETHYAVGLTGSDYTLENDKFTIKKEFLESLDAGEYIWYLNFDTETGADIRIRVND